VDLAPLSPREGMDTDLIRFVIGRLLQGVLVVFGVATVVFVLLHAAPGDPLTVLSDAPQIAPQALARVRHDFGLDRPIPEQYARYLGRLARGDLGVSLTQHRPVRDAVVAAIPQTLLLAVAALFVDFAVGIGIGVVQGRHAGGLTDRVLSVVTLTLYATPVFVLGLALLGVFGETLGWFPLGGSVDPIRHAVLPPVGRVIDRLRHLVLPALTLGLAGAAYTARHQRSALLETLRLDFVRAARARGLGERVVLLRHALRNALTPTLALAGLAFPVLLSGSVLVESVFGWPGMGRLAAEAIGRRDYPVVTAAAMLAAVLVVIGNLLADLAARAMDPRLRSVR
jgi:peptide/nickel transport system permease protein